MGGEQTDRLARQIHRGLGEREERQTDRQRGGGVQRERQTDRDIYKQREKVRERDG